MNKIEQRINTVEINKPLLAAEKEISQTNKQSIGLLKFVRFNRRKNHSSSLGFALCSLTAICAMATFLAPQTSSAVYCELQNFKACKDCSVRIPASCENHAYNGSIPLATKPSKLHWKISLAQDGSELIKVQDINNTTLKTIKNAKNLSQVAGSIAKEMGKKDKLELIAVEIPNETALYKDQSSTVIAAQMQSSANRGIASVGPTPHVGGLGRALKAETKNSKVNKAKGETK